jgi:hypothetical protein
MLTPEQVKNWKRDEIEKLKKEPPKKLTSIAYLGIVPTIVRMFEDTRMEIARIAAGVKISTDITLRELLDPKSCLVDRFAELIALRYKKQLFESNKTQIYYSEENRIQESLLLKYCFPNIIVYRRLVNGKEEKVGIVYNDIEYQDAKHKHSISSATKRKK